MSRMENLRVMKDGLEPDPNIRLEEVGENDYKIYFKRGDTGKLPGKAWAKVLTGIDPSKKGGYALKGNRWLHSGYRVQNGDVVAYNVAGSGERGNLEDLYVSAIIDGEAYVLSFCNWSDRSEKQSMIEDLEDIFNAIENGKTKETRKKKEETKHEQQAQTGEEKHISDLWSIRTVGEYRNGCITVNSDVLKKLKLEDGDIVIATIEVLPR